MLSMIPVQIDIGSSKSTKIFSFQFTKQLSQMDVLREVLRNYTFFRAFPRDLFICRTYIFLGPGVQNMKTDIFSYFVGPVIVMPQILKCWCPNFLWETKSWFIFCKYIFLEYMGCHSWNQQQAITLSLLLTLRISGEQTQPNWRGCR